MRCRSVRPQGSVGRKPCRPSRTEARPVCRTLQTPPARPITRRRTTSPEPGAMLPNASSSIARTRGHARRVRSRVPPPPLQRSRSCGLVGRRATGYPTPSSSRSGWGLVLSGPIPSAHTSLRAHARLIRRSPTAVRRLGWGLVQGNRGGSSWFEGRCSFCATGTVDRDSLAADHVPS
jgi:hypothetical protein